MTVDPADHRLRRARRITLLSLGTNGWTTVLLPAVGLLREPDPVRAVLGVVGLLGFTAAQVAVLHAAVTPWLAAPARRRRLRAETRRRRPGRGGPAGPRGRLALTRVVRNRVPDVPAVRRGLA
ncbi:hypothetical protein [Micromonospora sp. NPDC049240]|uniref:hypothetical protein n=1 Tax=Micromonospora sp. NPDC049240 TaxID=3155151 RepID=UPI0033F34ABE